MNAEQDAGQRPCAVPAWGWLLLFGAGYFGSASLGNWLVVGPQHFISFWLPAGLYVAALLLQPPPAWKWVVGTAVGVNLGFDLTRGCQLPTSLLFCLANTCESLAGAWLVRRFVAQRPTLSTLREALGFVVCSAMVSTILGATIGAAAVWMAGAAAGYWGIWALWWSGDAMGVLVVGTLVLTWAAAPRFNLQRDVPKQQTLEVLALALGFGVCAWLSLFHEDYPLLPRKYMLLPFLVWAALRLGLRGATAASFALAVVTALASGRYLSPVVSQREGDWDHLSLMQSFVAISTLTALITAALMAERRAAEEALRRNKLRYRKLFAEATEGIALADFHTGRLLDCNDAFLRMTGYRREELVGQSQKVLHPPEPGAEAFSSTFARHREGADGALLSTQLATRSGDILWVEIKSNVLELGTEKLVQGFFRNVTEKVRFEREREAQVMLLQLLNEPAETEELIAKLTDFLRQHTGCESIAVCLGEREAAAKDEAGREPGVSLPLNCAAGTVGRLSLTSHCQCHRRPELRQFLEYAADQIALTLSQRQTAAALRQSEEKFRNAFRNSAVGIVIGTPDCHFRDVNPAYCQIIGYTPEELLQLTYEQIIHPEDWPANLALVQRLATGEIQDFVIEVRCLRKDRQVVWVRKSVACFRGGPAAPLHFIGLIEDMTERKRAEEALRASERKFRSLFEHSPEAVFLTEPEGRVHAANPAACAMLGMTEEEICRLSRPGLVDPSSPNLAAAAEERNRTGRIVSVELVYVRKNGEKFVGETTSVVLPDGQPRAFVLVRDVSERKIAEVALRASEERYRRLFETESDAILLADCASAQILDINPAAAALYGYSREELLQQKVFDLSAEPERTRQAIATRNKYVPLRSHRRKDGTRFQVEIACSYFEYQGCEVHVAAIRDISERIQTEQALRESREQLRALAARLEAVREEERTAVAREIHDVLAQELTRLKLDIAWLTRRLSQPLDAEKQAQLCQKLTAMTQVADLAIGSVQRIATELRPVVLDSLGLCAAIEWQVKDFETRTGLRCRLLLPPGDLAVKREVATTVFRILQESLTNVARHAAATAVDIQLHCRPEQLSLTVQDNGKGISAEALSDWRSIGLLGMRERAALQGGHCAITGQPGVGTTVRLRLPLPFPDKLGPNQR